MQITNLRVHKVERTANGQRILIEFESTLNPTNGWLQYVTDLFSVPEQPEPTQVVTQTPVPTPLPETTSTSTLISTHTVVQQDTIVLNAPSAEAEPSE